MKRRAKRLLLVAVVLLVAGCASTRNPAPVIDRAPPPDLEKAAAPAPIEVKPGYYLVKKGDTLRGIALDHGQDYKDLAAWNNLENPNLIKVDQVLRVVPPEGEAVESRAVTPPIQIESRPVEGKPVTTDALKREPKGGTQPYTPEAWAQMQKKETAPVAAAPASAVVPAVPVPAAAAPVAAKPAEPVPVAKPAASPAAVSAIDWAWPTSNAVSAPYSEGGNKGLDFDGKVGDPVLAASSGRVTLVTNSLRGYGNLIVVKHSTSFLSVYAHNSKMLVSEGQTVTKGQKIAEIGSTDTDRPNLHFEIRREGKPVDPVKFLPQR